MAESEDIASRFVIGIDLGTTNCSAAYVDTAEEKWIVRDFPTPQLVAPGTIEARQTLPSCHYQAAEGEFPAGALKMPWSEQESNWAVGFFARDHGALVPGRLVVSAKSWLCHPGVDRTAGLLPWHGAPDVERLSPVEVSARFLAQIRAAWDWEHPEHPLAQQEVVLTVPASFDEVARELTVEAARRAEIVKLTLVEEPQAAFYAWINAQGTGWESQVKAGQKILVCDIGGGTTDFTLIRVRPAEAGKVIFHRVAVGQHLILGGDNLDLALAHQIEQKATNGGKLAAREWGPLVRSARVIKEMLLGSNPPERMTVNLAGSGSKLIGGARQIGVNRDEVRELLVEGFLPRVGLDEKPVTRRSGFQEFNLPYAADAAITKYLAAFLTAHRFAGNDEVTERRSEAVAECDPARPDVVLFNGGFFESAILRERLLEVIGGWFSANGQRWRPTVLENDRLDLAVSRGAAYYGMVRRGHGVRIVGGLAHSYYIGVEVGEGEERRTTAVCLLPAGVEEGHAVDLDRTFELLIRQPVEFPLYISAVRTTDRPGALVEVDPEQLTALPPIRTVLQSGRKSAADSVAVQLHAKLTAIGTLELWAAEVKGDRQWRLEFDVRSATRAEVEKHRGEAERQGFVDASMLPPTLKLIKEAFGGRTEMSAADRNVRPTEDADTLKRELRTTPAALVKRLELLTGMSRNDWPASMMRTFWEALMEVQEGRKLSVEHEARWLSLAGFCLRPGYGLAVDDWRVGQMWRLNSQKVQHAKNELCRAEWWILWRRLAGGLSAGQQLTLAEPLIAAMKSRLRPSGPIAQGKSSPFQYGPHEMAEVWRLLGSLELLRVPLKEEVGELALNLWRREKAAATANAALFAIGRLGARTPMYGPLNGLVGMETAEAWAKAIVEAKEQRSDETTNGQAMFTLVQLARRTGDRYRDVSDEVRELVAAYLLSHGGEVHYVQLVREGGELAEEEQKLTFGETLPKGLRVA